MPLPKSYELVVSRDSADTRTTGVFLNWMMYIYDIESLYYYYTAYIGMDDYYIDNYITEGEPINTAPGSWNRPNNYLYGYNPHILDFSFVMCGVTHLSGSGNTYRIGFRFNTANDSWIDIADITGTYLIEYTYLQDGTNGYTIDVSRNSTNIYSVRADTYNTSNKRYVYNRTINIGASIYNPDARHNGQCSFDDMTFETDYQSEHIAFDSDAELDAAGWLYKSPPDRVPGINRLPEEERWFSPYIKPDETKRLYFTYNQFYYAISGGKFSTSRAGGASLRKKIYNTRTLAASLNSANQPSILYVPNGNTHPAVSHRQAYLYTPSNIDLSSFTDDIITGDERTYNYPHHTYGNGDYGKYPNITHTIDYLSFLKQKKALYIGPNDKYVYSKKRKIFYFIHQADINTDELGRGTLNALYCQNDDFLFATSTVEQDILIGGGATIMNSGIFVFDDATGMFYAAALNEQTLKFYTSQTATGPFTERSIITTGVSINAQIEMITYQGKIYVYCFKPGATTNSIYCYSSTDGGVTWTENSITVS